MYKRITDEDPYKVPMRIYPAVHYTMGGLWVDYNLMSTIPGPVRARRGELLRSRRQPPRRQRADAGPGRRLLRGALHAWPTTWAARSSRRCRPSHDAFRDGPGRRRRAASTRCSRVKGKRTVREFHRALGAILWDHVGMARTEQGLHAGHPADPRAARRVLAGRGRWRARSTTSTRRLDYAGRVADYMEFAELLALDALERRESCGGHFREEFQTPDGEAAPQRRRVHLRRGVGVPGRRHAARAAQGAARVRRGPSDSAELQVGPQCR